MKFSICSLFLSLFWILTINHPLCAQYNPVPDSGYFDYHHVTSSYISNKSPIHAPHSAKNNFKKFIVPSTLVAYGVSSQFVKPLKRIDQEVAKDIARSFPTDFPVDDILQYIPTGAIYAFNLLGAKSKHHLRDYTLVLGTAHLIMGATVQTMKHTIHVTRPNNANSHSFPSGHTATAFVGAHVLFREYKDADLGLALSGYVFATATGYLRVTNQKHWVSDVATGAGIGILSTELAYLLLPRLQHWLGFQNKSQKMVILPAIGNQKTGVSLSYTF